MLLTRNADHCEYEATLFLSSVDADRPDPEIKETDLVTA